MKGRYYYEYYGVEGKYEKSAPVHGKPTWTSTSDGIWYIPEFDYWVIGQKEDIGKNVAYMYAKKGKHSCPEQVPSHEWRYSDNGWTWKANEEDVLLKCNVNKGKYVS